MFGGWRRPPCLPQLDWTLDSLFTLYQEMRLRIRHAESPKQSQQQFRAVRGVECPQQTPGISEIDKNQSNRPQWVNDLLKAIQECFEQSLPWFLCNSVRSMLCYYFHCCYLPAVSYNFEHSFITVWNMSSMHLYRSVETCFLEFTFTASYSKRSHVILPTQFDLALSMEYDQFINHCPALRYDIAAWIILTSVLCP